MCCRKELKSLQEAEHRCPSEGCLKSFANAYNLRRHMATNHVSLKRYGCLECKSRFSSYQELKAHEQEHRHSSLNGVAKTPLISIESENTNLAVSPGKRTRPVRSQYLNKEVPVIQDFLHPGLRSTGGKKETKKEEASSKEDVVTVTVVHNSDLRGGSDSLLSDKVSEAVDDLLDRMQGLPLPMFDRKLPMPPMMVYSMDQREIEVDRNNNLCFLRSISL
mmetsp:Transcript_24834/g.28353  ORF Transcript_24834/g.28353 Transcript_24834/m.28353 type:complete len:220 (-) Transcript_24834:647-1306(-)